MPDPLESESLGDVLTMAMLPLKAFAALLEEVGRGDGASPCDVGLVLHTLVERAERLLGKTLATVDTQVGRIRISFKDDMTPGTATMTPTKRTPRSGGKLVPLTAAPEEGARV